MVKRTVPYDQAVIMILALHLQNIQVQEAHRDLLVNADLKKAHRECEMRLTNRNEHVRLEVGDFLRRLSDEVVDLVVGDAEMLRLRHSNCNF